MAGGSALALLLVVVGSVLVYQVAFANRVYPGVRAFGRDLGGYSRDEASAILQRSVDEMSARQITLAYRELSWTMTAQELGLKADLAPVIESVFAVGREGNIFGRFSTQLGLWRQGRSFEQPSTAFDPAIQTTLLQRLAGDIDRPVLEAKLSVKSDFGVDLQPAQSGRKLDLEASRKRLQEALAMLGADRVELSVNETAPRNVENDLSMAREQATQILSAPISLQLGERSWTLDRGQLAGILRFNEQGDAAQVAYLDRAPLEAWARTLADAVSQAPQDARFSWSAGKLEVLRPSRDGVELDVGATVEAILAQAYGPHQTIPLPGKVTKPAVPMEDRQNLGIKELIDSSRTPFAGSVQAKQDNITLAAKRLNGVVVPPGGTFSFNNELGSTSLDAGFKVGWGITTSGGGIKTVPSVAGGICQVATTLFQSVFWSGYQIEERHWHLYWIQSYTSRGIVGLDATVDEEAGLDFKFINPTKNYILIQSWIDSGLNINFALYGTKPDWVVKVDPAVKTDIVPAEDALFIEDEQTMPEGNRLQVERATDGFAVTNVRHVIEKGNDRTLRLVSRYRPSRNVVLVGTGGKPPSGRTVVESNKPAPADDKVTPTPVTSITTVSTSVPATNVVTAPASVPTPVATAAPPRVPTAQPVAVPTARPAAPTATPGRAR